MLLSKTYHSGRSDGGSWSQFPSDDPAISARVQIAAQALLLRAAAELKAELERSAAPALRAAGGPTPAPAAR